MLWDGVRIVNYGSYFGSIFGSYCFGSWTFATLWLEVFEFFIYSLYSSEILLNYYSSSYSELSLYLTSVSYPFLFLLVVFLLL
jgi:hypothetical protein